MLGTYGLNNRMGRIPHFEHFDNNFFGIYSIFSEETIPESRMLLETTYEAIIDSGNVSLQLSSQHLQAKLEITNYTITGLLMRIT